MMSDLPMLVAVTAGAAAAAVIDLRIHRVPNVLTAAIAGAGFALAAGGLGRVTLAASVLGAVTGLLLMVPGHVFGRTGAGDVKLLAAFGTLLGPSATVAAFLATAIAGGVLALGIAAGRLHRQRSLGDRRFAYAPAIAAGVLLVAFGGFAL
jgi:prepilin peptidase CpaA